MSMTYPVPGFERDYPQPRTPDARLRVVPNETLLPQLGDRLGELIQVLLEEGADVGISVEIDTSDRTRPDELRGGASPAMVIALALLSGGAAGLAGRLCDAAVAWLQRHHRADDAPAPDDPAFVQVYGPDGRLLRRVRVPGGGEPLVEEEIQEGQW